MRKKSRLRPIVKDSFAAISADYGLGHPKSTKYYSQPSSNKRKEGKENADNSAI